MLTDIFDPLPRIHRHESGSLCSFGVTEALAAFIATDVGLGATAGAIGAGALEGAAGGALLGGVTGGDPLKGALGGAITGGFIPAFGGAIGSEIGSVTAGDVLAGAAGGALGSGLTGTNPLTGALTGGAAGGIAASGIFGGGGDSIGGSGSGVTGGGPVGASASAAPAGVPVSSPDFLFGASSISGVGSGGAGGLPDIGVSGPGLSTGAGFGSTPFSASPGTSLVPSDGGLPGTAGSGEFTVRGLDNFGSSTVPDFKSTLDGTSGAATGNSFKAFLKDPSFSTLGDALSKNANIAIPAAVLGGEALLQPKGPSESGLSSALLGQAQQLSGQGSQLASYLQSGTLPPAVTQSVAAATASAKAAIRSQYAARGMSGSSSEMADLAAADRNASTEGVNIAMQLLNQGVNETNLSSELYRAILQQSVAGDTALMQALGSFAGAAAGGPGITIKTAA